MPSSALRQFELRGADVDKLLVAHENVIRFTRVQRAAARGGGEALQQAAQALSALVSPPQRGRPANVVAINRAAIVLLSAHFEGYVEDLYSEAAHRLLDGKVRDVAALVKDGQDRWPDRTGVGMRPEVWTALSIEIPMSGYPPWVVSNE